MEEKFQNIQKTIDDSYLIHIKRIDEHIQRNLQYGGYQTRKAKSNGLWCCALLPTILVIYSTLYEVSNTYRIVSCISVGLLCYSILFLTFITVSSLILRENIYAGCVAAAMISVLLLFFVTSTDVTTCLALSFLLTFAYNYLLRSCIVKFPKTFTIGEAMVVSQGIALFTATCAVDFLSKNIVSDDTKLINSSIYSVYLTVGLIITMLVCLKDRQRNIKYLTIILVVGALFFLSCLQMMLGPHFIVNIFGYVFNNPLRRNIFYFWLSQLVLAVLVLLIRTSMRVKASTVTRKSFHILASLVFAVGILYDAEMMRFAAGVCLGVLILTEALRKSRIEPVASMLQASFLVYSDEKDSGSFAMTPIYLYVGLASPLLLCGRGEGETLAMLAGVLAVGVGDTAASWFGSQYGNYKWPGLNKTFEGTIFNILSQIGTVYALQVFELLNDRCAVTRTLIAATVTSLVEAKTEQVDNLILPFVNLIAFQLTWILS